MPEGRMPEGLGTLLSRGLRAGAKEKTMGSDGFRQRAWSVTRPPHPHARIDHPRRTRYRRVPSHAARLMLPVSC
jgi:hypothetical protein